MDQNKKKPDIRRLPRGNKFGGWRNISLIIMLVLLSLSLGYSQFFSTDEAEEIPISEIYQHAREGEVERFEICNDQVQEFRDGEKKYFAKSKDVTAASFLEFLKSKDGEDLGDSVPKVEECDERADVAQIINIVINVVILGAIIFAVLFLFRGVQSSGNKIFEFGQSKAKIFFGRKTDTSFKDVAGIDEAKEELNEVVLFLKDPKRFLKMGARIPKGLLLVGPPGTGKTLLARAIAGEAGVPFFHTSGAEFEEMLVGAGASRVRDLFSKAKKAAPALVFIDEIDAVARKRGTSIQTSSTEQTLNQILTEMDGFEKHDNVIIIAATNRPDVLDPAILRPGRFDRRVVIELPDIEGRKKILAIHAKNKPMADEVDMGKIAKRTVGYSGADLENMLNEAAIIVAKRGDKEITPLDLEEAATKVDTGSKRKITRDDEELRMTAFHEGGHAIVSKFSPQSDPVHRVTIVSRGQALGYVMRLPQKDQRQKTVTQLLTDIKIAVAGRAAEEIIFGEENITTGATNDIEKASQTARSMVKRFGMSEKLGMVQYGQTDDLKYLGYSYGHEQRDYSEHMAQIIDEEVKRIVSESYEEAKQIITEHRKDLEKIVEVLLDKEVIEGDEFYALLGEEPPREVESSDDAK